MANPQVMQHEERPYIEVPRSSSNTSTNQIAEKKETELYCQLLEHLPGGSLVRTETVSVAQESSQEARH